MPKRCKIVFSQLEIFYDYILLLVQTGMSSLTSPPQPPGTVNEKI